jgi:signal transduction histidine kinase
MNKKSKTNLLLEIKKLKKHKKTLMQQSIISNNLIAELLFLRCQSEAQCKAQQLFVAKVNHELRTPLNAILGFAQVMDKEVFGPIENKKYQEYVKYILRAGEQLSELVNNVLDFSKLEMNQMHLYETNVCVLSVLNEAVMLVKNAFLLEQRIINIHSMKNIILRVDEQLLKQIFLNILSNAVKFTKPDGKIDVFLHLDNNKIRFVFKDDGIGIPKEKIQNIFDPFYQIQTSRDIINQGTGLGLVLVKKMVILHQGNIVVKSVLNKGTILMIDFTKERVIALGDSDEAF